MQTNTDYYGRFRIIYADPPWSYNDKSLNRGGAERHYKTASISDIASIPLRDVVADDAVMFMWATYPNLKEALHLMESWGFQYKTCGFNWVKTSLNGNLAIGMGHHTRANAEPCLLGIRGRGVKRQNAGIRQTQLHLRTKHSEKPVAFRDSIELLYGINQENSDQFPRLEMFARASAPGWEVWGNEAPNCAPIFHDNDNVKPTDAPFAIKL